MKNLSFKDKIVLSSFIAYAIWASVMIYKTRPQTIESPKIVDNRATEIESLARGNGFKASNRVVDAILKASDMYNIDALELTAIGIIETGLGKYARTRKNSNGTVDRGLFQINTVNESACVEYNLDSPEGSAFCAAKLLSNIKMKHADYLGRYHSKTPNKKAAYMRKLTKALKVATTN